MTELQVVKNRAMGEYIFELTEALYNEETGEVCFKPTLIGEIVRCKNCKHYEFDENFSYYRCTELDIATFDDGFCYWGERRVFDETD